MTEPDNRGTTQWSFNDEDYYELKSFREQIEFLLRYAVLAPSSHNQQPWSFQITQEGVDIFADYTRRLPVIDPDNHELTMSLGAAIANLRVAAAHFGFESTLLLHEGRSEGAVATVALRETSAGDEKLKSLFSSIKRRHTNRGMFNHGSIEPEALSTLLDFVEEHPETFHIAFRLDKQQAADLIAFADHLLMADDAYRAELAASGHPIDGIYGPDTRKSAIPTPYFLAAPPAWYFDAGSGHADHERELTVSATALIVVTAEDDRGALLQAGEALEYLLLTITRVGLQYSFLNAPIHRAELRNRVQGLVGSKRPAQLIVRIGPSLGVTSPTPRRPLDAVVS